LYDYIQCTGHVEQADFTKGFVGIDILDEPFFLRDIEIDLGAGLRFFEGGSMDFRHPMALLNLKLKTFSWSEWW
jgi:hypothetical protein